MTRIFIFISAFVSMSLLTLIYTQVAQQPVAAETPVASLGAIELHATELAFDPMMPEVSKAGRYTIKLVNDGKTPHDVTFPDGTTVAAAPGQTASVDIDVPASGVDFICSIPGHAEGGMKGMIMVKGQAAAPPPSTPATGGTATQAVAKDPNAAPYKLRDATAPQLAKGTVHDIDLYVIEQPMTVADGFVQEVYAFGETPETATVPGPILRVKVGDTLRVHLKNPTTNLMPHSVDFHASMVAWNDEMTDINPGQEKLYEFKAEYAGVFMYHCGTAGALSHMLNGMYGMIIVEPKEGLPKVDHEFFVVQNEWYLGPQGQTGDIGKASASAPAPDFVVFNGIASQYKDNPIKVPTGDVVRVFVLDAGPNIDSSFHIVGTIFEDVIKEGVHVKRGNDGNWGVQAVDLAPAQGAIVEFRLAEDGLYPFLTHAFNFPAKGALGLFQAGDGDPLN